MLYATNLDAHTSSLREQYGLATLSPLDNLEKDILQLAQGSLYGVKTDEVFLSGGCINSSESLSYTLFGAHIEDRRLISINFLVAGQPKCWILIPERESKKFECMMLRIYKT
jgi:hypothetical protein